MDRDARVDAVRECLEHYYAQLDDPAHVDTDDLAENIASHLERKETQQ